MKIVKVGVIGCGEIAQWMHLPFLTELPGFQVTALCDISPKVVEHVGVRFGIERRFTDVGALLEHGDIDAVVIATPIHSDPAIAAAQAGKHVLVEKPMASTLDEAEAMVAAAEGAGVVLMVAYMKRYDPGYQYGQRLMREMKDVRLIRVHDLNGPNAAFVRDMTTTFRDQEMEAQRRPELYAEMRRRSERALGGGHPDSVYRAFDLLGGLSSHDIAILRGAFGSPHAVTHTEIWQDGSYILSTLDYGSGCRCVFEIGTTRKKEFDEELAAFGWHNTVRIRFPSPYVKYAPTIVETTDQEGDALIQRSITASYEEAFRRELEHFHACIVEGREPDTSGREGLEDVRLQIDIIKAALRRDTSSHDT
jgi:predicted dehydrogenase